MLTPLTQRLGPVPRGAGRISGRRHLEKMIGVILSASDQARAKGPRRFSVRRRRDSLIHSIIAKGIEIRNRIAK